MCPEPGHAPDFAYYREQIAERCGADMKVEFVEAEEFEHPPGTKFRLILSYV